MLFAIIALVAGFFILIKSADYLVDGASSIAKKYGVSPMIIGLTIVAFGTSAPELVVNIISATSGTTGLAVGNIMGSNLANLFLILGITAMFKPIRVHLTTVWREMPFMVLASVMVLTMAADVFLDGDVVNILTRTNGLSLLGFFVIFLYYTYFTSRGGDAEEVEKIVRMSKWKSSLMIVGGLVGLTVGGKLIVDGAVTIASAFGVPESLIGLTIVAIGTSLPELATSITAARKGMVDMAVGNVVGSNIFNIFFVLGVTSTIAPLPFSQANMVDATVVIASSLVLFSFLFIGTRHEISRWQGATIVSLYLLYIAASVMIYAV
ncbi:MAG: calcium/sodium antiporter [bacterium]|nr:calcium/sodium antiporter [bacterium]